MFDNLFSAPRFPEDNHTLHLTAQQVDFLCALMQGFRKNFPKVLDDPTVAVLELLVIHEKCIGMLSTGNELERSKADEYLTQVRAQIRAWRDKIKAEQP